MIVNLVVDPIPCQRDDDWHRSWPVTMNNLLGERTRAAGLPHVRPHQVRHTAAHMNLTRGMGESALQRIMGWSSPEMVSRYGASAADERAREAYRTIGAPGDLVKLAESERR